MNFDELSKEYNIKTMKIFFHFYVSIFSNCDKSVANLINCFNDKSKQVWSILLFCFVKISLYTYYTDQKYNDLCYYYKISFISTLLRFINKYEWRLKYVNEKFNISVLFSFVYTVFIFMYSKHIANTFSYY